MHCMKSHFLAISFKLNYMIIDLKTKSAGRRFKSQANEIGISAFMFNVMMMEHSNRYIYMCR